MLRKILISFKQNRRILLRAPEVHAVF